MPRQLITVASVAGSLGELLAAHAARLVKLDKLASSPEPSVGADRITFDAIVDRVLHAPDSAEFLYWARWFDGWLFWTHIVGDAPLTSRGSDVLVLPTSLVQPFADRLPDQYHEHHWMRFHLEQAASSGSGLGLPVTLVVIRQRLGESRSDSEHLAAAASIPDWAREFDSGAGSA